MKDGATTPEAAVDGRPETRWSSEFSDPQWLAVDLGAVVKVSRVELLWDPAFGRGYAIEVSTDGKKWTEVYKTDAGRGGSETVRFQPRGRALRAVHRPDAGHRLRPLAPRIPGVSLNGRRTENLRDPVDADPVRSNP